MENKSDNYEIFKLYENQLVIHDYQVVRLVDIGEFDDILLDEYFLYKTFDNKEIKDSVLLPFYPLKGIFAVEYYDEMERVWELNQKHLKKN